MDEEQPGLVKAGARDQCDAQYRGYVKRRER
jgi:hypothetical protein